MAQLSSREGDGCHPQALAQHPEHHTCSGPSRSPPPLIFSASLLVCLDRMGKTTDLTRSMVFSLFFHGYNVFSA